MSERTPTGKIITFYSYKGGTGRSMALANVAWILASAGQRVLVLDWDLEAPGLHRYFRPFLIDKELTSSPGIIDYIIDFCDEAIKPLAEGETLPPDWYVAHADIRRYRISIDYEYFPEGGKIDLVPAGQQGTTYATRVNAFNWQDFYQRLGGGAFLDATRERMREKYDYILIDSRTGVSDTAGICTVQMPDALAVFFTFNNQSIEGAAAVAQSVYEQRGKERQRGRHKFQILAIPTRVDQTEQQKLKRRKVFAHWRFNPFLEQIPAAELRSYWGHVEIPYVPYFAYEEVLAPFSEEEADDPKTLLASMKRIADFLVRPEIPVLEFASLVSPEDKQRILQDFAATPAAASEESRPPTGPAGDESPAPVESPLERQLRLADGTLIGLRQDESDEARRLWTRLVRVPRPGEKSENSKVRVSLSELGVKAHPLVDKLVGLELLSFGKDESTGQETIEVSNEELLRTWPRLQQWIDQDRWLFLWRQDLQRHKAEWEERGHGSRQLLRGGALYEARRWYKTHRAYLSDSEAAFIEASWRQRLIVVAAAALIILLLPLSFYLYKYLSKRFIGERLATAAQQSIDAANTGNQQADQFQLGILLATEALRVSGSQKAEALLRQNLTQLPRVISFSVQTNSVLRVALNAGSSQVLAVTGRPRGNQAQPEDRAAQLQDVKTGQIISRLPFRQGSDIFDLSPDGRYLAIADTGGNVTVQDVTTGNQIARTNHTDTVRDLAFSPDSRYFASASADRTVRIVDLSPSAKHAPPLELEYKAPVNAVTFSNDSRHLAVADDRSLAHVWQINPGATNWPAPKDITLDSAAFTIALSPNGDYLATIPFHNQQVELWQVASDRPHPLEHDYNVGAIAFSPDEGKFIVTGGNGGNITIWDRAGTLVKKLRLEGDVDKVIFSPGGWRLAVIGSGKLALVWEYSGGQFDKPAMIQAGIINDLAFGADDIAVTAGADNTIRVWQLAAPLVADLTQYEPCARLTRNLTIEEWNQYLAADLGAYRKTCPDIP